MATGQKSPLHPSALTINHLNPGRRIIKFSMFDGEVGAYEVCEHPVVREDMFEGITIMVKLKDLLTGRITYVSLTTLGIVRFPDGGFSRVTFTVDHRKRRLLPTARLLRPLADYSKEEEIFPFGYESRFDDEW